MSHPCYFHPFASGIKLLELFTAALHSAPWKADFYFYNCQMLVTHLKAHLFTDETSFRACFRLSLVCVYSLDRIFWESFVFFIPNIVLTYYTEHISTRYPVRFLFLSDSNGYRPNLSYACTELPEKWLLLHVVSWENGWCGFCSINFNTGSSCILLLSFYYIVEFSFTLNVISSYCISRL